MKKPLFSLLVSLALAAGYTQDSVKREPVEKYFYSRLQEVQQRIIADINKEPYVATYVNGFQYTEIADRSTWRDAELIAALPRSYTVITLRPCPCKPRSLPTKFL